MHIYLKSMNNVTKAFILSLVLVFVGCQTSNRTGGDLSTKTSYLTGWKAFDKNTTNFEAYDGTSTVAPYGMLPIPGGSFTIGQQDEFITAPRNSVRRVLTVSSFYMDKYEVTNLGWREYVDWTAFVFGRHNPQLVEAVLPDTVVWRNDMAYNEPYVQNYFRHPAYSFYPVVGVSWDQAMAYCQWRTDRVNEGLLVQGMYLKQPTYNLINGYMTEEEITEFLQNNPDPPEYAQYQGTAVQVPAYKAIEYGFKGETTDSILTLYQLPYEWIRDQFVFNTEKYLSSNDYRPEAGKNARKNAYGAMRKVNQTDGIMVVGYRLPTEAEWEYAAFAPIADKDGVLTEGRLYPWDGYYTRDVSKSTKVQMRANFVRSRGDMMGVAGVPDDGYIITAPVDAFSPNDFGLYNMAGNVNEWVLDVYRETTYEETTEYNPYRGNVYSTIKTDSLGKPVLTATGCIAIEYKPTDDKRDYKDGDVASRLDTDYPLDTVGLSEEQMESVQIDPTDILAPRYTKTTRVYKGGSWNDRIYWLNPTTRRYMDQSQSSNTVGFRCAMTIVGDEQIL
jgi:formylglycine-generating enzyme required for sulfatase activity